MFSEKRARDSRRKGLKNDQWNLIALLLLLFLSSVSPLDDVCYLHETHLMQKSPISQTGNTVTPETSSHPRLSARHEYPITQNADHDIPDDAVCLLGLECSLTQEQWNDLNVRQNTYFQELSAAGILIEKPYAFSPVITIRLANPYIQIETDELLSHLESLFSQRVTIQRNRQIYPAAIPDDPRYADQWFHTSINSPGAWDTTTGNEEVVMAVFDTGIDIDHPDLADSIWQNPGEIRDNGIDDDLNGLIDDVRGWNFVTGNNQIDDFDVQSHGSQMAGLIAAAGNNDTGITGVTWRTTLLPVKLGDSSFEEVFLIQAIDYVIYLKTALGHSIAGINFSAGFSDSTDNPHSETGLYKAIKRAQDAGILFITAAGNSGTNNDEPGDTRHFYPSDYDLENIISVTATTELDSHYTSSNYGASSVDLGAPGVNILSADRMGGYSSLTGSSPAAALVSGCVALTAGLNRNLDYRQIKDLILNRGDINASLAGITKTGRRLNLSTSVATADSFPSFDISGAGIATFREAGESITLSLQFTNQPASPLQVSLIVGETRLQPEQSDTDTDTWEISWITSGAGRYPITWQVTDANDQVIRSRQEQAIYVDQPYDYWRFLHWGDRFYNLSQANDCSDPDKDGLQNKAEYFFGLDPESPEVAGNLLRLPSLTLLKIDNSLFLECRFTHVLSGQIQEEMEIYLPSQKDWQMITPEAVYTFPIADSELNTSVWQFLVEANTSEQMLRLIIK